MSARDMARGFLYQQKLSEGRHLDELIALLNEHADQVEPQRDDRIATVREAVEALRDAISDYQRVAGTTTTMPDSHEQALVAVVTDLEELLS